jgi:2,4-dienoyl-CoA reductase-like NADH-dependent reductase (Old Yellow Enzyme family)
MPSKLFSPFSLRNIELANRVVVAPMCQYSAADGAMTDWHTMHLGSLAASGAGLLMIEATGVEAIGRITPGCTALHNDEQEETFARVIDICKTYGSAKIGLQLAHAGRKASVAVPWQGSLPLSIEDGGWQTIGPSALPFAEDWHTPTPMDHADLDRVSAAFVSSAKRALRVGVDVLELHMAHGYLLNAFLSPIANQRDDEYGGSLENRMRYPLEVFAAVRAAWPDDRPLGVRISATDWEEPGWTPENSVTFASKLKELGCDFVDCSSGGNTASRPPVANLGQGYQVSLAEQVKQGADMATMAVGMIRDPEFAEDIITSGKADLVAIARGFLYEPGWARRAAEELGGTIEYPDQYKRAMPENWSRAFPNRAKAAE